MAGVTEGRDSVTPPKGVCHVTSRSMSVTTVTDVTLCHVTSCIGSNEKAVRRPARNTQTHMYFSRRIGAAGRPGSDRLAAGSGIRPSQRVWRRD
jgi:hypothetical protein